MSQNIEDTQVMCGSYSRYSSDLQDEGSIEQQQIKCREAATNKGLVINPKYEFADEAVSGTKLKRAGLDAAVAAAKRGEFQVLFFQSLSRLARESLISMSVIKDLVFNSGVRVICVAEGLDTINPGWELIATQLSLIHEHFVKTLSQNVRRGHEYALQQGYALPDWPLGYTVEDMPGTERGKGRDRKCRRQYVIVPVEAEWIRQIFAWYTQNRWSLSRIARELTRRSAPKDHRARTKEWKPAYVSRILGNTRYIGQWPWGQRTNKRNPLNGKSTAELRPEVEWRKYIRDRQDLRIIDDATWNLAQARLADAKKQAAKCHREKGKFKGTRLGDVYANPRHLLAGLLKCAGCGNRFHVGGNARMVCSGVAKGLCDCRTQLNRKTAEALITYHVVTRVWETPAWEAAVFTELQVAWRELRRQHPDRRKVIEGQLRELDSMIERLLHTIETSSTSGDYVISRLRQREQERARLAQELADLESMNRGAIPEPSQEWVRGQLQALQKRLQLDGPSANPILRELVGGAITLTEIKPDGSRPYWRGMLTVTPKTITGAIASRYPTALPEVEPVGPKVEAYEVEINFIARRGDEYADRVKELRDRNYTMAQIAKELGIGYKGVRNALRSWYQMRGLERPADDDLRKQTGRVPEIATLAEQVMPHYERGLSIQAIAAVFGCGRNKVSNAISYWYKLHGGAKIDGRARYQELRRGQSPSSECELPAE